jgi:ribose transport system ATP-binding protein
LTQGSDPVAGGSNPPLPSATPILSVRGLTMAFPGQLALDGVSLSLSGGEVTALLGQNGSGKSTLIKVLAGVYHPETGAELEVAGRRLEVGSPVSSHELGLRFVHQELGLIDALSATENIALSAGYVTNRVGKISWAREAKRARRMLERLGAEFDVREPVARRDAVERTAIAVARALWDWDEGNTGLLVLDEPTATMPPEDVARLFEIVRTVRDRGAGVLYVSHRLDEIFEIADRAVVLREGQLVGDERVSGLDHQGLTRLMLGRDPAEPKAEDPAADGDGAHLVLRLRGLPATRLAGLNLDIRHGEIVGVTGLQGSGREDLAYAVTDKIRGERLGGEDEVLPDRVAIVPVDRQRAGSIPAFTVRENFAMVQSGRFMKGGVLRKRLERRALEEWADRLDLVYESPEQRFSTLSGGNQQKVILARWLATRPELMVIDEPTHGVDIGARATIHDIVRSFAAEGLAFLLCSSDVPDLMAVCTRILVIRRGDLVADFSQDSFDEPGILAAMMGGAVAS